MGFKQTVEKLEGKSPQNMGKEKTQNISTLRKNVLQG